MSAFVAASGFSPQGRSPVRLVSSSGSAVFGVSLRPRVRFQGARPHWRTTPKMADGLYDIKMRDIDGNRVDFSSMKGKPILAVNVACFCGYTKKVYSMMKYLSEKYEDKLLLFQATSLAPRSPAPPTRSRASYRMNMAAG
ncbi:hypothetical protein NDN08_006680 [Rhodosorus marinus]|uniref:Glutathione peroxidase n=1 Tax=Rhodosorus marinus TaxID=101924 RepID=A0AAV8UMF4_9RHOD|nr:hypothetical protein NDN08_006680 [Rhodosorus marinus]